jgi:hypothetical protein
MKLLLKAAMINIAFWSVISSWTMMTEGQEPYFNWTSGKEPSSVLKLLSVDIPHSWNFSADIEYWATVNFEANGKRKEEFGEMVGMEDRETVGRVHGPNTATVLQVY